MACEHQVTEPVVPNALNHHHEKRLSRELRENRYVQGGDQVVAVRQPANHNRCNGHGKEVHEKVVEAQGRRVERTCSSAGERRTAPEQDACAHHSPQRNPIGRHTQREACQREHHSEGRRKIAKLHITEATSRRMDGNSEDTICRSTQFTKLTSIRINNIRHCFPLKSETFIWKRSLCCAPRAGSPFVQDSDPKSSTGNVLLKGPRSKCLRYQHLETRRWLPPTVLTLNTAAMGAPK